MADTYCSIPGHRDGHYQCSWCFSSYVKEQSNWCPWHFHIPDLQRGHLWPWPNKMLPQVNEFVQTLLSWASALTYSNKQCEVEPRPSGLWLWKVLTLTRARRRKFSSLVAQEDQVEKILEVISSKHNWNWLLANGLHNKINVWMPGCEILVLWVSKKFSNPW